jgi:ribosomal protein S18 acetylase RimI-like enzyme
VAVQIRTATAVDAEDVARVLAAGFHDDPVMTWIFADDREPKLAAFFNFLAGEVLVPLSVTYMVSGACAGWTPPDPEPWSDERTLRFAEQMGAVCTARDFERLQMLGNLMDAAHPPQPYWYLSVLATVPAQQGNGLGSRLLRHSLTGVDASGLPAYLESTNPRNVSLYERHGFRVTDEVTLPDGPVMALMWRDAAD